MIAKVLRRKSFKRTVRYVFKLQKNETMPQFICSDFIDSKDKESMIKSFNAIADQRKDIKDAVWHTSLNLAKDESLSDKQWNRLVKDFLKKMGLENHQFIAVKHESEEDREHVHLIVNRVNFYSEIRIGWQERRRAMQACRELEVDYNLQRVTSEKRAKTVPSKNEVEQAQRTGEIIPKVYIQESIDKVLAEMKVTLNTDIFQFIKLLERRKIYAVSNVAQTGKMNGFSFYYNAFLTTGRKLGNDYNWTALQNQLNYNQTIDSSRLLQEKERLNQFVEKHAAENNILLEKPTRRRRQKAENHCKQSESEPIEYIQNTGNIRGKTRAKPHKQEKVKNYEEAPKYQTCFFEICEKKRKSILYKEKLFFDIYQYELPKSFEDSYLRKKPHCTSFSFKDYFLEDFGSQILMSFKNKKELENAVSASLDLCIAKGWNLKDIVFNGSKEFIEEAEKQRDERLKQVKEIENIAESSNNEDYHVLPMP